MVVDKVIDKAKINDLEFIVANGDKQYFWDGENGEKLSVAEGIELICDCACSGGTDWADLFGLTDEEKDIWDNIIDKVGLGYGYTSSITRRFNESTWIPYRKSNN